MKPSQVASTLRRIATAIEKSRKPDKNLVAKDLKRLISVFTGPVRGPNHHQSGDPGTTGYDFVVHEFGEELSDNPDTKLLNVMGIIFGKKISGQLTIYTSNGIYDGYEYKSDPSYFDIKKDSEMLSTVLDAAVEELKLES